MTKKTERREKSREIEFMRRFDPNLFYVILLCFLFFIFTGCATTAAVKEPSQLKEEAVITALDVQNYAVKIAVNKPFVYTIYRSDDPYKTIVELLDVSIGTFNKRIVSDKAGISEIIPSQIESPTFIAKLEMLLQTPSMIEPEYRDNTLVIRVRKEEPLKEAEISKEIGREREVTAVKEEVSEPVKEQVPLSKASEITDIFFEKTDDIVKVEIKGDGSMTPDVFPLENRIVIDIPDVEMKAAIPSALVSPITGLRAGKHKDGVRLVLDLKERTNFDVASIGNSVLITLQGPEREISTATIVQKTEEKMEAGEKAPLEEGKYTGKTISLDFQDADIIPIFRLLADISGYNIVVSPEVKGRLTMKLINVPWDQALDIILKTFSLGKSVEGNIIRIAPYAVFARESEEAARAQEAGMKAESLETRIFPVSYAQVRDIEKAIKDSKVLSPRGSTSADERTRSLLVNDIPAIFPQVESLLMTLDKPTSMVQIEGRIVELNTTNERELGIQWGLNFKAANTLSSIGGFSGLGTGSFTGRNFVVDFPAVVGAGAGSGITFGILSPDRTLGLDLQLSAIETIGQGKVISNPRIMTVDNKAAKIMQGKSIPIRKIDVTSGQISTEYKDISIELNVTPQIKPDKTIGLEIEIKKEELDPTVPSIEGVPGTDKKEAKTNVTIKDGETLVIGGMYKINTNETESGIPG
ncbi:MAG: type IV pilus secretin PilQ, partial [Nitrospirota bacterium]